MSFKNASIKTGVVVLLLSGCASSDKPAEDITQKRFVTDNSLRGQEPPKWVADTRQIWEEGAQINRRGQSTILGHQRLSACYELAKVEAKTGLLTEIQEEIKGFLDVGETGLSEDVESAFNRAVTTNFAGKINGLQVRENFYERYVVGGKERVDCFVLTAMKKTDFDSLRRSIINKVAEVDPRLRELAVQKQMALFSGDNASLREPSQASAPSKVLSGQESKKKAAPKADVPGESGGNGGAEQKGLNESETAGTDL
jgi:hypothetical protein